AGERAATANARDNPVELGMEQGLAATLGDDGAAEFVQAVDAAEHFGERDGLGEIVELVAVGAGKIAAADGDDMGQDRVSGGGQAAGNHAPFAQASTDEAGG